VDPAAEKRPVEEPDKNTQHVDQLWHNVSREPLNVKRLVNAYLGKIKGRVKND